MNSLFLALALLAPPGEYDSLVVMHANIERIKAIPNLPNDLKKTDAGKAPQAGPVENKERVLVFLTRRNLKYCSSAGCFYTNPKACEVLATDLASLPKIEPKNGVQWVVGDAPDSHFEVVYVEDEPELAKKHRVTDLQCPVSVKLSEGKEAARLSGGTAASLSKWYSDCLKTMKQMKAGPNTVSGYPESNTIWNVDGDWNPSKNELVEHLMEAEHAGRYDRNRLEELDRDTLYRIHAAHHDVIGPTGKYKNNQRASGSRHFLWWSF